MSEEMKVCGSKLRNGGRIRKFQACGKLKPLSQFRLLKSTLGSILHDTLCIDCSRAYGRSWYARKDADYKKSRIESKKLRRALFVERLSGIRPKPNACESCGRKRRLVVDHDHETGRFRGWLCHMCNTAEGLLRTQSAALGLLKYMQRNAQEDFLTPDISAPISKGIAKYNGPIRDIDAG